MTITSTRHTRIKRYGFLVFLTPVLLPWIGVALWQTFGAPTVFAFFTLFYVYGIIPALDILLGKDPVNSERDEFDALTDDRFYRRLTYLCVPIMAASLLLGGWGFVHLTELSTLGLIGWAASHGVVGGALGINAAHELIHKNTKHEQWLGGVLLAMVCYPGFQIEHLRGHHINVSTPKDASSSRLGQSLFHFLPRAIVHNLTAAWQLERTRLARKGLGVWHRDNGVLRGYALSAAFGFGFFLLFGVGGAVFFVAQSFVAILTLETVNYLEHYGLTRKLIDDDRYERTNHTHSWNSNYLLTNMLLFQLQRHSDHHEFPARRYQVLRHIDESPQLPAGYATMMVLAWCPPLWRRVMDPRVKRYYRAAPQDPQPAVQPSA